jgi:hypothetical protein
VKFRTPVVCQNLHRAFWHWETDEKDIGHVTQYGVPDSLKCSCLKQELGEGYARAGNDQQFTGWYDRTTKQEIYEGDIVITSYHWTEWHIIELPSDFYDIVEFALVDDMSICGNVFMNPEMARTARG